MPSEVGANRARCCSIALVPPSQRYQVDSLAKVYSCASDGMTVLATCSAKSIHSVASRVSLSVVRRLQVTKYPLNRYSTDHCPLNSDKRATQSLKRVAL